MNRLCILCAALDEAISQNYEKLKNKNESRSKIIDLTVDVVFSLVPASDKLSGALKEYLKTLPTSKLNESIQGFGNFAAKELSEQFSESTKNHIDEFLTEQKGATLIAQGQYRDALRVSFLIGFRHDIRMDAVRKGSLQILNELEGMRK